VSQGAAGLEPKACRYISLPVPVGGREAATLLLTCACIPPDQVLGVAGLGDTRWLVATTCDLKAAAIVTRSRTRPAQERTSAAAWRMGLPFSLVMSCTSQR
jgi:hypothetical protein